MKTLFAVIFYACFLAGPAGAGTGMELELPAAGTNGLVYLIPIRGNIEPALLYVIRRGLTEAETQKADAIIFVMDTPGGTLGAASDIVRTIQGITVPTYTFVEKQAFSAGAIIALATDQIYMAPGSVIGDALPIMMSPLGGVQEMPESVEEKAVSGVAALVRSAAQESGHDPLLAEKMVRRDLEYKIGEKTISPTGQLLTLTNVEAEQKNEEGKSLLSAGTVKDVPALLAAIGKPDAVTRELAVTSIEKFARWIAALAPLFLMGGLLGIYIEVKTPGFGLPGILGVICLAIFFWGHHIAGLAGMEDLLLFLFGAVLLVVEILFLPGFGAIGLVGIVLMLWSLLGAMVRTYPGGPWWPEWPQLEIPLFKLSLTLVGTAVLAVIAGRYLPQTPLFRHLLLEKSATRQDGFAASATHAELLGAEGRALAQLRPSGPVLFGNRKLDVVTQGEFIESGEAVRIVETHGNRIIVEAVAAAKKEQAG